MEASTTFIKMLTRSSIRVPGYQRAYSWDVNEKGHQVNTYYDDLVSYANSLAPYYLGHFLFQENNSIFYVIDGQQRLTTSVLFLNAAYRRLSQLRALTEEEDYTKKSVLKIGPSYVFETVSYDAQVLRDIIDATPLSGAIETDSQKRLIAADNFFSMELADKGEEFVLSLISTLLQSQCSTHVVRDEAEATQMFIFQNNRGKKPTKLEIIKAYLIHHVVLNHTNDTDLLLDEIKNRFEKIYKAISSVEHNINEDTILGYTSKVYFNDLAKEDVENEIKHQLLHTNLDFVKQFVLSLARDFDNIVLFYKDLIKDPRIQLLAHIGRNDIVLPFFLKARKLNLSNELIFQLMDALGDISVRDRVIRTRADLIPRLNDVFKNMDTKGIQDVVERIEWMKNPHHWWWGYWKNKYFEQALSGGLHHGTAKILLWCYENHLIQEGKAGYQLLNYDSLVAPQLEHIAPQTENEEPASGYPEYDEDFISNYLNCLGNYLLLSGNHNISIGNRPFAEKRETYTALRQQIEVKEMTPNLHWTKENIQERQKKIMDFILNQF